MPVLHLGYHVVELRLLTGDGGEGELSFGLGEPEAGPVGPESRKVHCQPVDVSSLGAVWTLFHDHVGVTLGYPGLCLINYHRTPTSNKFIIIVYLYSELHS